jgi:predicted O-methyltransferase YrrM
VTGIPTRLPGPVADELADRSLRRAVDMGVLPAGPFPDWTVFRDFRRHVRDAFDVPQSSITPLMARVLYGVAHLVQPVSILVIGSYYGNTLVWLAGPGFGPLPTYVGRRALGVDVDAESTAGARANFARLGVDGRLELEVADGHAVGLSTDGPFDLVLLDADDPVRRKEVYLSLLDSVYPRIVPGGLVLAHDICVPIFAGDLATYRRTVRDDRRFAGSVSLEIDPCGLELSRVVDRGE